MLVVQPKASVVSAGLVMFMLSLGPGCASDRGVVSSPCVRNTDCQESLVCTFGRCHRVCVTSRDCPDRQECIDAGTPVCRLPTDEPSASPDAAGWDASRTIEAGGDLSDNADRADGADASDALRSDAGQTDVPTEARDAMETEVDGGVDALSADCDPAPPPSVECFGHLPGDTVCIGNEVHRCSIDLTTALLDMVCTGSSPICLGGACVACRPTEVEFCGEKLGSLGYLRPGNDQM